MNSLTTIENIFEAYQEPGTTSSVEDVQEQKSTLTRYGFKAGDIGLLVSENTLCEVMKNFRIYPIPHTKEWLPGLVNLRGNLIPVCDISLLLNLSDTPMKHENLLIIDRGLSAIGILVNANPQPCNMKTMKKSDQAQDVPSGLAEYVTNTYISATNDVWLSFNYRMFFEAMKSKVAC